MKLSGLLLGTLIASSTAMAAPDVEMVVENQVNSQELVKEHPQKDTGKERRTQRKAERRNKRWIKNNPACGMG
jgi:hypothetical protein